MMYLRILVVTAILASQSCPLALPPSVQAATLVRNVDPQRGLELLDGRAAPWLTHAGCGVQLTDGTMIDSRDSRYQATTETQGNRTTVQWIDTEGQLNRSQFDCFL
jgi:hypothetical protein